LALICIPPTSPRQCRIRPLCTQPDLRDSAVRKQRAQSARERAHNSRTFSFSCSPQKKSEYSSLVDHRVEDLYGKILDSKTIHPPTGSRSGSRRLGRTHPLRRKAKCSLTLARAWRPQCLGLAPKQPDDRAAKPAVTTLPTHALMLPQARIPHSRRRLCRQRFGRRAVAYRCDRE